MIASDTMSFLFDQAKAIEKLETLEKGWGGPPAERLARQMAAFRLAKAIEKGEAPPAAANAAEVANASNGTAPATASPPVEDDAPPPPGPSTVAD